MARLTPRTRRSTALLAVVLLVLLSSGCRPSGERRLVSLREGDLAPGLLHGQLVYVETAGVRQSAVFVHDLWSGERRRIRRPDGLANAPAWSPDGQRIAFSLTDPDGSSHLWLMRADGTQARQLTDGPVVDDHPRWSPDGSQLVFSSIRDGSHDWRLFRVDIADGTTEALGSAQGHSLFPDWSPDGESVVYANRPSADAAYTLALHDLATGEERRLTHGPGEDLYPRFTADGSQVLFSSDRGEDVWQIFGLDLASDTATRLVGSDSMDEFPTPSPQMEYIAFSTGHLAVYRADGKAFPDGKLRWRLTLNLAWAPDWKDAA